MMPQNASLSTLVHHEAEHVGRVVQNWVGSFYKQLGG